MIVNLASSQKFPLAWNKGKEKTIGGHTILKETGSGSPFIYWTSKDDYKAEMVERSKREFWPTDSINSVYSWIDKSLPGGIINMKIVRLTIEAANTKYFSCIVFSNEGQELFRKDFTASIARLDSSSSTWWNTGVMFIPVEVVPPFKIAIIDKLSNRENYVFVVKN